MLMMRVRENLAVCCCQFASWLLPFPDGQSACICLEMSYSSDLFLQEQTWSDFCGGRKQGKKLGMQVETSKLTRLR